MRSGFIKHFGGSPKWWLVVILITQAVIVYEIAVMTIKKTCWPNDVDIWQVLEKDDAIKQRLQDAAAGETSATGGGDEGTPGNAKGKAAEAANTSSEDQERDIQDLLDRPRAMQPLTTVPTAGSAEAEAFGGRNRKPSAPGVSPREF